MDTTIIKKFAIYYYYSKFINNYKFNLNIMKLINNISLIFLLIFSSCAAHKQSNIQGSEEFVVELVKPTTRGGLLDVALEGLFFGANYLTEKSAESLTSSYSQSISINDYYNTDLGEIEKTYGEIHIKKYSKPVNQEEEARVKVIIRNEFTSMLKSRGQASILELDDIIRDENDDLLNFHAVIELVSDPENPGITRLSFDQLRVFFSKTKIFTDENLNAKISILIEGQWRDNDGSPHMATLIEQEYDFKNLKYGYENQINTPILSPWYYDIPIISNIEDNSKYGVLKVNIQLEEYEGNKSNYINKLPSILSDNKNAIIKSGSSTIQKIIQR